MDTTCIPRTRRSVHDRAGAVEHRLLPLGGSWLDLTPPGADAATRLVFACLQHGVLEAWQSPDGSVRFYLPDACGGHLIVDGPDLPLGGRRDGRTRPCRRPA